MKNLTINLRRLCIGLWPLLCSGTALAADLPAGAVINASNLDQSKADTFEGKSIASMLTDKMELMIREHGLSITLRKSAPIPLDRRLEEATRAHSGGVTFDTATRTVKGWKAGLPFPDVREDDPNGGEKLIWNMRYGSMMGDQPVEDLHFLMMDFDKGLDRIQKWQIKRYMMVGRLTGEGATAGDGSEYSRTLLYANYPHDIRGVGTFTIRYSDPARVDDSWVYVKSVRRVRRLSGNAWMDPIGGTVSLNDDIDGWDSPPSWYRQVKLVGKRWILAVAHGKPALVDGKTSNEETYPQVDFKTPPYINSHDEWEPREVWIIEGTPPEEHPYGKKVVYMDTRFPRIYQAEMYDKKGDFWKFFNWHHSVVTGKDGFRAIGPLQGEQVDLKARKATIFVGDLKVNEPMTADDVTLGKLEAAGR
ncbi:DUF1329 domain-containing protein [Azoarcus sp. L1K30]|uniref:DUF1329 domain-containing protein n=1 Tax=Azoarcus sp. L1K30 TaxID=2820277 RepID=UPI001B845E5E|nr:DUF1329 domain-containing protein [Azoarcus sp. L1K30]MBR0567504.1 DUF1329 domain-containing protein [Azoarcus sp. L1K30]